jgi:hypothetical protein
LKRDYAQSFRGLPEIRRVEHHSPERRYLDEINLCTETAALSGHSVLQPENGLFYVAMKTNSKKSIPEVFSSIKVSHPWVFSLNEFKTKRAWAPYSPFTLSIRSEQRLYEFLQGSLYLMVIVDVDVLREVAAKEGFITDVDFDNEEYPLTFRKNGEEGHVRISGHILKRMALEFTSPEWIIRLGLKKLDADESPGTTASIE